MSEAPHSRRTGVPFRPEMRRVIEQQRETSPKLTREEKIQGFYGWHERGYLPHRDEPGLTQFVTFRLADSFPAALQDEWEKLLKIEDDRERRIQLEDWLDLGHGSCHLRDERLAQMVADALHRFDGTRYHLLAWTIMPNHVHVLFEVSDIPMRKILHQWKGATARAANASRGLHSPFWQKDYWDTYMRDPDHQDRTIRYIRNNPVKAGLVSDWKAWPWTYVCEET
ncbi:REP-associated tyrosine transposase [Prosthecobacter fluviatilis]|uniref:Transposase n=1 Tax=Prosthecobacter fluviatilis TaxID=445931 RepID=A0ABW0KX36_9BACT